jgi:uncharacterized protein YdaU (DUF1376 family)
MTDFPFMQTDPAVLLADTAGLTPQEFGAFWRICCQLWLHKGFLPDDDRELKRMTGVDNRNWPRMKQRLASYLMFDNGMVSQKRVLRDREKVSRHKAKTVHSVAYKLSATECKSDSNEINNLHYGQAHYNYNYNYIKEISPDGDTKKAPAKPTPRQELESVLDASHAEAVIEHRQRMRRPLTAHAAHLLAGKFGRTGDANASADTMIANGWQGFDPAWLTKKHDPPSRKRNFVDAALDRINGHDDTAGLFDDHRDAERLSPGSQQPRPLAEDLRGGAEGHRKPGHH